MSDDLDALVLMLGHRFDNIDRRLDAVDRALAGIVERLALVEDKVDRASGVRFVPTGC